MAVEQGPAAIVNSNPAGNDDSDVDEDASATATTAAAAAEATSKSYARKPLPQVKTVVSRAFRWYRSNSVDNISQLNSSSLVAQKPAVNPKPAKTTAANKGISLSHHLISSLFENQTTRVH